MTKSKKEKEINRFFDRFLIPFIFQNNYIEVTSQLICNKKEKKDEHNQN